MADVDPRNELAEGFNRARLRIELRRGMRPGLWVVAATLAAVAGFGYMVLQIAPTLINSSYTAKLAVDDASYVVPGVNEVRIKGLPAGTIEAVERKDGLPVLKVSVESRYGRIYRDARAQLRPETALNNLYLDIVDRGTEAAGELGEDDVLAAVQTETPVDAADVLNVFEADERQSLRTLLDDLGSGLDDGGRSLRAIFVQAVPFLQAAGEISDQVARRSGNVRRLVHNANVLTRSLGDRERELRTLLVEGGQTLRTLQAGSADLDATLRELPATLAAVQQGFPAVRGTLDTVDTALRSLYPVADELRPSLSALSRLASAARPAVSSLRKPVTSLVPFAQSLRPLSRDLDRTTRALAPQVDTFDYVTDLLVKCETGVQNFFQWNVSISKFGDARGPVPRGNVVFGPSAAGGALRDPGEYVPPSCAPGKPVGGREARVEDQR
ncbi:MAG: hypothetical protein JWR63_2955 [Conexibacter sp.]|nr:hypothetical protein [Conexibacter sp.]